MRTSQKRVLAVLLLLGSYFLVRATWAVNDERPDVPATHMIVGASRPPRPSASATRTPTETPAASATSRSASGTAIPPAASVTPKTTPAPSPGPSPSSPQVPGPNGAPPVPAPRQWPFCDKHPLVPDSGTVPVTKHYPKSRHGRRIAIQTTWTREGSKDSTVTKAFTGGALFDVEPYVRQNREEYCACHGYTLEWLNRTLNSTREATWSKMYHAVELLTEDSDLEWLLVIDGDAVFTDLDVPLERFINDSFSFIGANDVYGWFNGGHMLMKNTPWTRAVLKLAIRLWHNIPYWHDGDQEMMEVAFECYNASDFGNLLMVDHQTGYNAGARGWRVGMFSLHLYGPNNKLACLLYAHSRVVGCGVKHGPVEISQNITRRCEEMRSTYGIATGRTWGSASSRPEVQKEWTDLVCDLHFYNVERPETLQ